MGTKFDIYPRDLSVEEYEEYDELFKMLPFVNGGHVLTSSKLNFGVKKAFEKGLEWHVNNEHSPSLINENDIKTFEPRTCCLVV